MSNYKYSSELLDDILFRSGEPTDGTSDFEAEALRLLNRAYRGVWNGGGEFVKEMNEAWLWLKKDPPGTIILQPVINAGSVSVTNNDANITFSVAPSVSVAGRFFRVDGVSDVFRIFTHTASATAAVLDTVYTGTTGSGFTYRAMKLEYDLATDLLRPIAPMRVQAENRMEIDGRELSALEAEWPLSQIEGGTPETFALVTDTKVRFNRYGGSDATSLIRVEYDYLARPADLTDSTSEEPLIPLQYRQIISDIGLFYIYTTRGDDRAIALGQQVTAGLRAMESDNKARMQQISRTFGKLLARGHNRMSSRWPLRTESGFIIG